MRRFVDGDEGGASRQEVTRADGRVLRRITAYFPKDLSQRLLMYCAKTDQKWGDAIVSAVEQMLAHEKQ